MTSEAVNAFLLAYAGLFPIVNPLGGAPVFLSLTQGYSVEVRHRLAGRVAINGFLLLLGSLLAGSYLLEFFGITLPVMRIAGGLVVSAMAWKLLNEGDVGQKSDRAALQDATWRQDAFYPLTMPLTVGPGSIAVAITLGSQRPRLAQGLDHLAFVGGGAILGLAAIALTIYAAYRSAATIERIVGASGINVLIRLSAFILLCIGIQIIWNGYEALMHS